MVRSLLSWLNDGTGRRRGSHSRTRTAGHWAPSGASCGLKGQHKHCRAWGHVVSAASRPPGETLREQLGRVCWLGSQWGEMSGCACGAQWQPGKAAPTPRANAVQDCPAETLPPISSRCGTPTQELGLGPQRLPGSGTTEHNDCRCRWAGLPLGRRDLLPEWGQGLLPLPLPPAPLLGLWGTLGTPRSEALMVKSTEPLESNLRVASRHSLEFSHEERERGWQCPPTEDGV